ncbi:hypothetical protein GYMLUDRAFT_916730 [Collybiopsis luxurians FD-317 M1]|uniref:Uncharacterized protein n=1 Tax=Collybiopsis luxurians FD-317 M1 TaxID=944289 RepID=A0A0D0CH14_9AGAR|nr:hypothetical protein GYMLUDRAFT_916730 [Collybiopsis luxurians FD-317 M1]
MKNIASVTALDSVQFVKCSRREQVIVQPSRLSVFWGDHFILYFFLFRIITILKYFTRPVVLELPIRLLDYDCSRIFVSVH